jgi:hypothetical protein
MKLKHIDTANRDIFPSVIALFFSVTRYCFLHVLSFLWFEKAVYLALFGAENDPCNFLLVSRLWWPIRFHAESAAQSYSG